MMKFMVISLNFTHLIYLLILQIDLFEKKNILL